VKNEAGVSIPTFKVSVVSVLSYYLVVDSDLVCRIPNWVNLAMETDN